MKMIDDPDHCFKNVRLVNFNIINHKSCGKKFQGPCKHYKTIKNENVTNYAKDEANVVLSVAFHNKTDLWIKRDLM